MHRLKHGTGDGTADGPYDQRVMIPMHSDMAGYSTGTGGLSSARNVIPQVADQLLTYVTDGDITGAAGVFSPCGPAPASVPWTVSGGMGTTEDGARGRA